MEREKLTVVVELKIGGQTHAVDFEVDKDGWLKLEDDDQWDHVVEHVQTLITCWYEEEQPSEEE